MPTTATYHQAEPAENQAVTPKVHLGYLDSMRALAALYVVLYHAPLFLQYEITGGKLPRVVRWLHIAFAHGHYAVCIFIVLSGFCLMLPVVKGDGVLRGGALHFFKKRARRILPPYYLALAVSLLLIWLCLGQKTHTDWQDSVPVTIPGFLSHLLLLQDFTASTGNQIDYPLWSVSVEWRIYFIFPLLILLWRKIGPLATTLGTIIVGYTIFILLRQTGALQTSVFGTSLSTGITGVSPEFLGLFGLGALGAGITYSAHGILRGVREKVSWIPTAAVATVFALLLTTLKLDHGKVMEPAILGTIVGVWAMIVLIAAGSSEKTLLHRTLSWRPLAFLGTFAYSIYLIHGPVLQMFWLYLIVPLHLSNAAVLCMETFVVIPLTVAVAYLFFLACERPFLTRRVVLDTT